jgi:hypothetical protein
MAATLGNLADLTYFNNRSMGGIGDDEVNSARAQQMLANLRQYDPNAAFAQTYGGDGQSLGYTLNFDPRKLPGVDGSGQLGQGAAGVGTGNTFMPRFSTVQQHMTLANPNAVANSPVYGKITDNGNIVQQNDIWSTLGPALVGLFAMGIGPLAGAMSGGAITATNGVGAGANAFGRAIGNTITGTGRTLASGGRFDPLSLLPVAGAGLGIPSWVTTGVSTLGRLAHGGNVSINPVSTAIAAAPLLGGLRGA